MRYCYVGTFYAYNQPAGRGNVIKEPRDTYFIDFDDITTQIKCWYLVESSFGLAAIGCVGSYLILAGGTSVLQWINESEAFIYWFSFGSVCEIEKNKCYSCVRLSISVLTLKENAVPLQNHFVYGLSVRLSVRLLRSFFCGTRGVITLKLSSITEMLPYTYIGCIFMISQFRIFFIQIILFLIVINAKVCEEECLLLFYTIITQRVWMKGTYILYNLVWHTGTFHAGMTFPWNNYKHKLGCIKTSNRHKTRPPITLHQHTYSMSRSASAKITVYQASQAQD